MVDYSNCQYDESSCVTAPELVSRSLFLALKERDLIARAAGSGVMICPDHIPLAPEGNVVELRH